MSVIMTVTPTSVPEIEDNAVIIGGADPANRFPPVREYIDTFAFSAEFTSDVLETTYVVTDVTFSPSLTGITTSFSGNTINISGSVTNVFPDKHYEFRMNDGSVQILPPDTTQPFYGITKYQADFLRYVEVVYTITLSPVILAVPDLPITFTATQTVNNDWESNRLLLKQLVLQGGH